MATYLCGFSKELLTMKRILFLSYLLIASLVVKAQENPVSECPKSIAYLDEEIRTNLTFLASDDLQGRYPGSKGETVAAELIASHFAELDITPFGDENFYQPFPINDGILFTGENFLNIKKASISLDEGEYYVTRYSSNGEFAGKTVYVDFGIQAPDLEYNDFKGKKLEGKVAVINVSSPDGIHPHSKYMKYHDLGGRIENAKKLGASGVILIDPDKTNLVRTDFERRLEMGIPVIFVAQEEASMKLMKKSKVDFKVNVTSKILDAKNVVGFLDNGAKETVIIGAHYDHLGMGGHGSLYRGEPAIHNGADDNASGVAGLMALASYIKNTGREGVLGQRNYLFIAFSGEEKGLLGSNFFVKSERFQSINPAYMLNMDMIGHLDIDQPKLIVNGVGTSPFFEEWVVKTPCLEMKIKTSAGGIGPSDHTSFYNSEVPVLHFFTGAHDHYHRPTDDVEIINFEGLIRVLDYMIIVMEKANGIDQLEYTATPEQNSTKAPRFSVTMGVVPDYAYDGKGMRVDGVTKGKPADKAGVKKGDVVVELHGTKVVDMMSYMRALGELKAGVKTKVKVKRNGKTVSLDIQF